MLGFARAAADPARDTQRHWMGWVERRPRRISDEPSQWFGPSSTPDNRCQRPSCRRTGRQILVPVIGGFVDVRLRCPPISSIRRYRGSVGEVPMRPGRHLREHLRRAHIPGTMRRVEP